jgi:hypothetical protein
VAAQKELASFLKGDCEYDYGDGIRESKILKILGRVAGWVTPKHVELSKEQKSTVISLAEIVQQLKDSKVPELTQLNDEVNIQVQLNVSSSINKMIHDVANKCINTLVNHNQQQEMSIASSPGFQFLQKIATLTDTKNAYTYNSTEYEKHNFKIYIGSDVGNGGYLFDVLKEEKTQKERLNFTLLHEVGHGLLFMKNFGEDEIKNGDLAALAKKMMTEGNAPTNLVFARWARAAGQEEVRHAAFNLGLMFHEMFADSFALQTIKQNDPSVDLKNEVELLKRGRNKEAAGCIEDFWRGKNFKGLNHWTTPALMEINTSPTEGPYKEGLHSTEVGWSRTMLMAMKESYYAEKALVLSQMQLEKTESPYGIEKELFDLSEEEFKTRYEKTKSELVETLTQSAGKEWMESFYQRHEEVTEIFDKHYGDLTQLNSQQNKNLYAKRDKEVALQLWSGKSTEEIKMFVEKHSKEDIQFDKELDELLNFNPNFKPSSKASNYEEISVKSSLALKSF